MDLDKRLVRRYHQLVRSPMSTSDLLSPGVKSSLHSTKAFSQTQAAWRFFNNKRCTLQELMKPILEQAVTSSEACRDYGLIIHDWSGLSYKHHESKQDRFGLHNQQELGYELQASLLLSDEHGGPIAPVAINIATEERVLSTYSETIKGSATHLDELRSRIDFIEACRFNKPLVHIIDREGDSVQLMRALENRNWLVRCRSNSNVSYQSASVRVDKLANQLSFTHARTIKYKGQKAEQYLADIEVVVTRAANPKKMEDGKRKKIKGDAVPCRLIVSKVQDSNGKILAWWYLLTNIKTENMGTIALWYYWRWSIETFFKLLKSAGMQLESWQQETGDAIARRLLIACMACVCVWQIAEKKGPEAEELRVLLVRLSGKQMKYRVTFTKPALFSGLCSLLTSFDLLEKYDPQELKQMLRRILGEAFV